MPKIKKGQISAIIMGVLIAYAITATAFIATAIGITYTNLQESALPMIVMISCFVSVLVAGFDAAKKAEQKGWAWGMCAGAVYAVLLMFIIMWVNGGFVMDFRKVILSFLCIVGGAIGGAIGINFKK